MPTQVLPTRQQAPAREAVRTSFVVALGLHAGLIAAAVVWALVVDAGKPRWGENAAQSGSISATMVPSIPLPSKQRFEPNQVLTSDHPSIAPRPPEPKTVPPPQPKEVLIPEKVQPKPAKVAPTPTPEPPKHPQPTPVTPKATTGETSGVRIPMAVQQVKNGVASITVDDRSFGERYAYYTRIVDQKISQSWNSQDAPPGAASGMRAIVVFTINADGTPSDVRILNKSGNTAFDTSALRTIQRIDGFGTLPQTKPITVEFALDYRQP